MVVGKGSKWEGMGLYLWSHCSATKGLLMSPERVMVAGYGLEYVLDVSR